MAKQARAAIPAGEAAGRGPFDLAHLERATFGDRALTREVLGLFDRQAVRLLDEIAAATNSRARGEAAHGLKGAARGVGALALARAAEEIEVVADDPVALIAALACLSARVTEARLALAPIIAQS
jgi:HPt (histidine-containing phosphotransfer) domain-containing protein